MKQYPHRRYKEDTPLNTIKKIRNTLADVGIFTYEMQWGNPYENIYSTRVIADTENGEFGQNGKGKERDFALASAYAEYIERLQNGHLNGSRSLTRLFLNYIQNVSGSTFYPDEVLLTKTDFYNLPNDFLFDLFKDGVSDKQVDIFFERLKTNGYEGVKAVPFYDVKNSTVVNLPFSLTSLLTGSNGMAAGNTVYEGLFQGLCEILERQAASTIYYNQLTPPSIGKNFLKNFTQEFHIISEIEKNGEYNVVVKDFSCNMGIPAIGVIVINKNANKYKLNIGCDTSFAIALSRALTENYQGFKSISDFDDSMLPIPQIEHEYFLNDDEHSIEKRNFEYRKYVVNGLGVYPKSLFGDVSSYEFQAEVFQVEGSYKNEVAKLLNIFLSKGHNVYIRDVSFLGFPSYFIYVPDVSSVSKKTSQVNNISLSSYALYDEFEDLIYPLDDFDYKKIKKLVAYFDKMNDKDAELYADAEMADLLKLNFKNSSYWNLIPVSFFMVNYCNIIEDFVHAEKWLKTFMKTTENEQNDYYKNALVLFEYKKTGNDYSSLLSNKTFSDVVNDFSNENNLFSNINIPACPNCDVCSLSNDCLTTKKISTTIKINKAMKNNTITQIKFKEILFSS